MFRTEHEFTLPKGYVDPEGNLHRQGVMRLATAADEILPLRDPRVEQNPAYLLIILLSRVVINLGRVKPITPKTIEGRGWHASWSEQCQPRNPMSRQKVNAGDVFAVPLPDGEYLFGRVLLDIYATTKRRLFPPDSPLPGLGKALLIEMYGGTASLPEYTPSEMLIPGAFVEVDKVGTDWPIVAHVPVDVQKVQFPETLIGHMHAEGEVAFECGEIRVLIPITHEVLRREFGVYSTRHSAFLWHYVCLHQLGRGDEIPSDYPAVKNYLRNSDLRFTEHRTRIYEHLPLDINDSYYQQQAKLGLNLERLYQ